MLVSDKHISLLDSFITYEEIEVLWMLSPAPGFTHRHYTRLEKLSVDKHISLLQAFLNYGRKKSFKNIGPRGLYHKTFNGLNKLDSIVS